MIYKLQKKKYLNMNKILCITPIKHLGGVYEKLSSYGDVIYKPDITKQELKKLLDKTDVDYYLRIQIDKVLCWMKKF